MRRVTRDRPCPTNRKRVEIPALRRIAGVTVYEQSTLEAIAQFDAQNTRSPNSYRELAAFMGYRSPSGVYVYVRALQEKGFLTSGEFPGIKIHLKKEEAVNTAPSLTPVEQRIYDCLISFFKEEERYPTIREIMSRLGYTSPDPVRLPMLKLQSKGYISWEAGKPGTIRLTKYKAVLVERSEP